MPCCFVDVAEGRNVKGQWLGTHVSVRFCPRWVRVCYVCCSDTVADRNCNSTARSSTTSAYFKSRWHERVGLMPFLLPSGCRRRQAVITLAGSLRSVPSVCLGIFAGDETWSRCRWVTLEVQRPLRLPGSTVGWTQPRRCILHLMKHIRKTNRNYWRKYTFIYYGWSYSLQYKATITTRDPSLLSQPLTQREQYSAQQQLLFSAFATPPSETSIRPAWNTFLPYFRKPFFT